MTTVAIIGAGMSGLCMAIKLQDADIESYTIYEQASDVGGTWRDKTYPGLHCDVPSRYYTYSFRPNPEWSRSQSPGPEIQEYFRQVADERNIRPHICFDTEVHSARYRDGQWWLTTSAGEATGPATPRAIGTSQNLAAWKIHSTCLPIDSWSGARAWRHSRRSMRRWSTVS